MSEQLYLPKSQDLLVKRSAPEGKVAQIQVWKATDVVDKFGRQWVKGQVKEDGFTEDGEVAFDYPKKPLSAESRSPERQAELAEELALDRPGWTPEQMERGVNPDILEAHSEEAREGIEHMGEKAVETSTETNPEDAETSKEKIEKEFDKDDVVTLSREFDAILGTVEDVRKFNPQDVDQYAVQAALSGRLESYGSLHESGKLSREALGLLTANMLGASTDVEAARRIVTTKLETLGLLKPDEVEKVKDFSALIDRRIRSEPRVDSDVIISLVRHLQEEAYHADETDKKTFALTLSAIAGGLASHITDPALAHSVASSAWKSKVVDMQR